MKNEKAKKVLESIQKKNGIMQGIKENIKNKQVIEAVEATTSQTASKKIIEQIKINVKPEKLNKNQKLVYDVIVGNRKSAYLRGKDKHDLYKLERGSRKYGLHKILIKHAGVEKTGGLNIDELLNMSKIIKKGVLNPQSFELKDNFLRYAYELLENGVKYRLVVDEGNDGKKIFDFYSDRNFIKKE